MKTMKLVIGGLLIGVMMTAMPLRAQEEQEPGGERLAPEEQDVKEAKAEEAEGEETWVPGKFAGNVAFYTDYSFRGISQTQKNMAFQGGLDWTHDTGFFLGLWDSTVHFGDAYLESDFYGGYAGSVGDFSYSVLATFFYYPSDEIFNYWEFIGKTGYNFGFMSVVAGLVGSPDYFGTLGTGFYLPFGLAVPLPLPDAVTKIFTASVDGNAGYTHADEIIFAAPVAPTHHYWDWNVGLVATLPVNINLDFRVVGTTNTDHLGDGDTRFIFGAKYVF